MKELLTLFASLCIAELVHNTLEIWGMRQKVSWLRQSLNREPHGKWPINIDSKLKTVVLHALILLVITGSSYFLFQFLNLTNEFLIVIGIMVLLLNYILTTWNVDAFHREIGRLIKKAKEK